jgi:hypothetical protein
VLFSQKHGFPLKAGGSPAILGDKTCQYILKYGWCGVRFVFVVISPFHCFLWRSLAIFGRVFSIVVLVHFCRYNLPLWSSQFSPLQLTHTCYLPSSFSFLRLIFLDPLSPSKQGVCAFIFLLSSSSEKSSSDLAPRRGEGRVICLDSGWTTLLDAMVSWILDGQRS